MIRALCYFIGVVTGAIVMATIIPEPPAQQVNAPCTLDTVSVRTSEGHQREVSRASFRVGCDDLDSGVSIPETAQSDGILIWIRKGVRE